MLQISKNVRTEKLMPCYFLSETENEKYVNTYFRNLKQLQNVRNGKSCTTDETPYLWMQCHPMKTSTVASQNTLSCQSYHSFYQRSRFSNGICKKNARFWRVFLLLSSVRRGSPYWYPVLKVASWCPTFWANRVKPLFDGHFVKWSRLLPRVP